MTDLLTDDEARLVLGRGIADANKSALLDIAISAVTQVLEDRVGPVVYGTVTGELHSGGGDVLYLKYRPVVQVTQVVEYSGTVGATLTAESNTATPDAGYRVQLANGRLVRRSSNGGACFPLGVDNVLVTYVAGRCQGTAIPAKYKMAAALTLKSNWRAFESSVTTVGEFDVPTQSFPGFMVPKAAMDLLASEWQSGSGGFD